MLPFIAVSLLLTACGRGDSKAQHDLTGTWIANYSNGRHSTIAIRTDGNYSCKIEGYTNGPTVTIQGRMRVNDGFIVDTCTKHSSTNARVPFVTHIRIVRMDDRELVVKPTISESDKEIIFTKVAP